MFPARKDASGDRFASKARAIALRSPNSSLSRIIDELLARYERARE